MAKLEWQKHYGDYAQGYFLGDFGAGDPYVFSLEYNDGTNGDFWGLLVSDPNVLITMIMPDVTAYSQGWPFPADLDSPPLKQATSLVQDWLDERHEYQLDFAARVYYMKVAAVDLRLALTPKVG